MTESEENLQANDPVLVMIDDALGFVKGNVTIISHAAEEVWNQMTVEDRRCVLANPRRSRGEGTEPS
jgi:hypothetical protein